MQGQFVLHDPLGAGYAYRSPRKGWILTLRQRLAARFPTLRAAADAAQVHYRGQGMQVRKLAPAYAPSLTHTSSAVPALSQTGIVESRSDLSDLREGFLAASSTLGVAACG